MYYYGLAVKHPAFTVFLLILGVRVTCSILTSYIMMNAVYSVNISLNRPGVTLIDSLPPGKSVDVKGISVRMYGIRFARNTCCTQQEHHLDKSIQTLAKFSYEALFDYDQCRAK